MFKLKDITMHKILINIFAVIIFLFSGRIVFASSTVFSIIIGLVGLILPFFLFNWYYRGDPIRITLHHRPGLALSLYTSLTLFFLVEVWVLMVTYQLCSSSTLLNVLSMLIALGSFGATLVSIKQINKKNREILTQE